MADAFLATVLFAVSVLAAGRTARILGSNTANLWRLLVAAVLLGAWSHTFGSGLEGGALPLFLLSGAVGFGLGDFALFHMLPRLGPRLSSLMINCLSAPFGAAIEWLWLGTGLTGPQLLCGVAVLGGVGLSLAPEGGVPIPRHRRWEGILLGTVAAFGQGFGAVLTRRAFAQCEAAGYQLDGGTAAYQRILGGLGVMIAPYAWLWFRHHRRGVAAPSPARSADRTTVWRWVALNAIAGPALGVAFYQMALRSTPSGVVLPITAMAPLVVIPFTYYLEGDRPGWRSIAGGVVAVLGVIGLTLAV